MLHLLRRRGSEGVFEEEDQIINCMEEITLRKKAHAVWRQAEQDAKKIVA